MKKRIAMILAVSTVMSQTLPIYASAFPAKSEPGSSIEVLADGETITTLPKINEFVSEDLVQNKTIDTSMEREEDALFEEVKKEASNYPKYIVGDIIIPEMEEGMTAFYDGMGDLTKVVDKDGNIVDMPEPIIDIVYPENYKGDKLYPYEQGYVGSWTYGDYNENTITRTSYSVTGEGWITYYNGVGLTGSDGTTLTNNDCATKMNYDRPPKGTSIQVRNLNNNFTGVVYKYDIGGLPNAVLDIMPDKMLLQFGATGRFKGRYWWSW